MNYIKQLQSDNEQLQADIQALQDKLEEFKNHLASAKFGVQADGSRGDWIATSDVFSWLNYIKG